MQVMNSVIVTNLGAEPCGKVLQSGALAVFAMKVFVAAIRAEGSWEEAIFHCICTAAVWHVAHGM